LELEVAMRFLALPAVLLLAAAAPATNVTPSGLKPVCKNPAIAEAASKRATPGIHPLSEEPPAQAYYAVMRTIDGCNRPQPVSERIDAPKR
jgi:hypothetical protein